MIYENIVGLRRRYGDHWATSFPNDLNIPWRQLTLQEFIDFQNQLASGKYTLADIEDEIFCLTVLDKTFTTNIDILPAGMVSSVVAQVLQVSGSGIPEQISADLNLAREQVGSFFYSAVTLICSVFPAYKPEDVLSLNYDVFLMRLAMAEARLLELGVFAEPLNILHRGVVEEPQIQELPSQRKKRELLEKQREAIEGKLKKLNPDTTTKLPEGVISSDVMRDVSLSFVPDLSNDPQDHAINQMKINKTKAEAMQGLEHIYPEYFKLLKEGKKITPEIINEVRGSTKKEVTAKHNEYVNSLKNKPQIPAPPAPKKVEDKPEKVKVKRR